MVAVQNLHIHSRLIIEAFHEALGNDLHEVTVARIVLRQQHQMVIPILILTNFSVKTRIRCHIHLTAQDRVNPRRFGRPVKINDTIHNAVIRDGCAVHAQLLDPGNIFFYLIRAVQETVLRMDVQMCKFQTLPP